MERDKSATHFILAFTPVLMRFFQLENVEGPNAARLQGIIPFVSGTHKPEEMIVAT